MRLTRKTDEILLTISSRPLFQNTRANIFSKPDTFFGNGPNKRFKLALWPSAFKSPCVFHTKSQAAAKSWASNAKVISFLICITSNWYLTLRRIVTIAIKSATNILLAIRIMGYLTEHKTAFLRPKMHQTSGHFYNDFVRKFFIITDFINFFLKSGKISILWDKKWDKR